MDMMKMIHTSERIDFFRRIRYDIRMKRCTLQYSVLQSFYWIGSCLVYSYAERLLSSYGFQTDAIGLTVACAYLAAMLLQPLLAAAADRARRITLRIAICGCALLAAVLALGVLLGRRSIPVLAVLFGALSGTTLIVQPLINAVGFDYINRGETLDFSFARGAASVAYALGSLLLGMLADWKNGSMLVFYLLVNVALFIAALFVAPNRRNTIPKVESEGSVFTVIKKYPMFLLFCFGYFVLFIPHNFVNAYLASITGVTGGSMSIMLAVAALVEFPAMMAYSHIRKRIPDRILLVASAAVFLLKTGLLLIAAFLKPGAWIMYLSFALQMLCYAIFTPAASYYANDTVSESDQVKGQMLLTESTLLSGVISMLCGGLSIRHFGVPVSLILCEGLVFFGVLLIALAVRRKNS